MRYVLFIVAIAAFAASNAAAQATVINVSADGKGDVKTVQAAIDRVPEGNKHRVVIAIAAGTYVEQIKVPPTKPFITLRGSDAQKTVITYALSNKDTGSTSASFTAYIGGSDFRAENVTFENSYGTGSQAVAALVEADRAVFDHCRFLAWQDTLYAKDGRQFYRDCYIEGHVDFIFGEAAAFFENCEIHSKADGYITAPMRFSADEPTGLIFYNCRLTSANTKKGVLLGRPWRDYGRTVFINTRMDADIRPEGWDHWLPERERTAFFGEYNSSGSGGDTKARVAWAHKLTDAEITPFLAENFLRGRDGWNPHRADDAWLEKTPPERAGVTWSDVFRRSALWYQTDEAARIADQLLLYQKENGGFEKNIDMATMLTRAEREALAARRGDTSETTIDNRTTYPQIAFLARIITASMLKTSPPANLANYKTAFYKGLDYLLASQYENGGFPQFYPLKKGYYTHITFNDDAMIGALRVLRSVARGEKDFLFVDADHRARSMKAIDKGLALILKLQVRVNGRKSVWAPQYDENSLEPAWARKFEPPCLTAGESVGIVRYLMEEKKTPEIAAAIESAIAWYKENAIHGIRWVRSAKGENSVIKDASALPIWARFYEIPTMKPIFIGRDSVIRYDVAEIEAERRNGYAWYVSTPNELLDVYYPRWKGVQ